MQLNLRSAANWTSFPRSDVASKRIAIMEILFLVGVRVALVLEEGLCGAVQFFNNCESVDFLGKFTDMAVIS